MTTAVSAILLGALPSGFVILVLVLLLIRIVIRIIVRLQIMILAPRLVLLSRSVPAASEPLLQSALLLGILIFVELTLKDTLCTQSTVEIVFLLLRIATIRLFK